LGRRTQYLVRKTPRPPLLIQEGPTSKIGVPAAAQSRSHSRFSPRLQPDGGLKRTRLQTSRGLVVGSQDNLVVMFWRGEGVCAQLFGKILNGSRLSLLGEGRCAAGHGRTWGPELGPFEIFRCLVRVVDVGNALDVLPGGRAAFCHVNVHSKS